MKQGNIRKYLKRFFIGLFSLLLVLYLAVYIYIRVNKKEILRDVAALVSKKVGGKLSIGNADISFFSHFPNVSVVLENTMLTDSLYEKHHHIFFQAKEVHAQLSILKLIRKSPPVKGIAINQGSIFIYTDTSGYSNAYLLKPRNEENNSRVSGSKKFDLKQVSLESMSFVLQDERKNKLYDFAINKLDASIDQRSDLQLDLDLDMDILVKKMAFNLSRGVFLENQTLKGNFPILFNPSQHVISFQKMDIKIGGQAFDLNGRFVLTANAPHFELDVSSDKISYEKIKEILPTRIRQSMSIVQLDKPLDVSVNISGPLTPGDPKVLAKWKTTNSVLRTNFMDFEAADFSGVFTNEVVPGLPRKDPNSSIRLHNFSATWHGLPVQSDSISINDLSAPTLTCNLRSAFPLTALQDVLENNSLEFLEGQAKVDLNYNGPLKRNDQTNSFLNGTVSFSGGRMNYVPRSVEMKEISGKLSFKNSDLLVDSLHTVVYNNPLWIKGSASRLLTLLPTSPNSVQAEWFIYSPNLNLSAFSFLLKPRKKHATVKRKKKGITSNLDRFFEEGKLHVMFRAGKLGYRRFSAADVKADISFLNDSYLINNVSLMHAGGKMALKGSLVTERNQHLQARIDAQFDKVNVRQLFHAFENFGQDGITAESIGGKFSANVGASMLLNHQGEILPASLVSEVDFSLKDGELNNYEPMQKLQKFIFKKRDFENIRFAELKNKLSVKNEVITIYPMQIQSSVMSLFVEGIYSSKGSTDISIRVPLSNLKKRDSAYVPHNIEKGKKPGSSIYLRGRPGADGKINFTLDLFNKYKKQKLKK